MVAMFQVRSVSFTVAGIGYPAAGEVLWLRHTPGGKPKEETTWEDDFPQKIAVSVLMTKTSSQLTLQNTIEIPRCKVLLLIVCCKFPSGWWFGTCFIFHSIWDNPSHWLSDFSSLLHHQAASMKPVDIEAFLSLGSFPGWTSRRRGGVVEIQH